MHRSRLGGFIIDCLGEDLDGAADFWSQALGLPRRRDKATEDAGYIKLEMPSGEMDIEVQRVDHPSRVHLDIEADDIPAEVARLEKLGARKIVEIKGWVVMAAPTGHRFCVVRAQSKDFDKNANSWE
ncbi:VOC family protein [Oceanibaculum sp.]|uniref:VOC family protein n=1 Tax=Oceanibaculum sp. TaxID=1903597 RepID=UPI0025882F88|nr:VOC family protein [Oceanibaculum sp.]MCH2396271.1 VOC family protein [Oceanibaculum sp.]